MFFLSPEVDLNSSLLTSQLHSEANSDSPRNVFDSPVVLGESAFQLQIKEASIELRALSVSSGAWPTARLEPVELKSPG